MLKSKEIAWQEFGAWHPSVNNLLLGIDWIFIKYQNKLLLKLPNPIIIIIFYLQMQIYCKQKYSKPLRSDYLVENSFVFIQATEQWITKNTSLKIFVMIIL